MRYLLDTCVLIWSLDGNKHKLSQMAKIIENQDNEIVVSVISYWEIVVKSSLGKLVMPNNWAECVTESGFVWLNLVTEHVHQLEKIPCYHNDPFDRLLIAQAQAEQIKLLTLDEKILQYF